MGYEIINHHPMKSRFMGEEPQAQKNRATASNKNHFGQFYSHAYVNTKET